MDGPSEEPTVANSDLLDQPNPSGSDNSDELPFVPSEITLEQQNKQLTVEIEQCQARIVNQSNELTRLKNARNRAQTDLGRVQHTHAQVLSEIDATQQRYDRLHRSAQEAVARLQELMDHKGRLEQEIAELKEARAPSSQGLALELATIEAQMQTDQAALDLANEEVKRQVVAIAEFKSQRRDVESKLAEQSVLIQDFRSAVRGQDSQMIEITQEDIDECQENLARLTAVLDRVKQRKERQEERLEKLKKRKSIVRQRQLVNEKLRERIGIVRREIKADESKLQAVPARHEDERMGPIAALAETLQSMTAASRKKKREVADIRDEALALKFQAQQLDDDLRLAESIIQKQEEDRARLLAQIKSRESARALAAS
jgi:chromosome segregation ATPase